MMDAQTCLLGIVLAIISGAVLLFISMFEIQEKTYEEAIAEQRKLPNDSLLFGKSSKSKIKNQKRQGKKAKEKSSSGKVAASNSNKKGKNQHDFNDEEEDDFEFDATENEHGHVNFLTPEAEVLSENFLPGQPNQKKNKKEKIKPILINKKQTEIVKNKSNQKDLTVNHFTEIIPKDDLQLKLINSKNNQNLKDSQKEEYVNGKENLVDKGLKVKDKLISQLPLKEINNKVESRKNSKNDISKDVKKEKTQDGNAKIEEGKSESVKNGKIKNEKSKNDNDNVEKGKNNKTKNEKEKDEKAKNEKVKDGKKKMKEEKNSNKSVIKNEKDKNGDQKPVQQQQQQQIQKHPAEAKQSKSEGNDSYSVSSIDKPLVQGKKLSNQLLSSNKLLMERQENKNELLSFQQMMEKVGISINLLIPLIKKAELSRTEVQILTDILLTKHLDEVSDHFEWIEGRQDPVVKLKKQLAEKEKALTEEQEACQAFQSKLKELRTEFNSERARLTQACRQYDETILSKQGEIQNLHATNRHLVDSHLAEKQALTQKIQQLQAQVNEKNLVIRKLQEDHSQTHNALQQELVNQGQQMEIHIGRLSEQLQEAQESFEAQIHGKIQEAEQMRASFNTELQKNRRLEEELRESREQQVQSQNKIKNLESRASQFKESTNHTQELMRQIEELQRANKELEIRYNNSHKLEEDLKFEKTKLQNEIHDFTNEIVELQNECEKLHKEREKLNTQMASKVELEKDLMTLKKENQSLISQVTSFTKIEREAQRLREENENLAAQVTAFTERPAADGRENGDLTYNEEKKKNINIEFIHHENEQEKDIIIERLEDDLREKTNLVEKLNSQIVGFEAEIENLTSEVNNYKTEIPKLKEKLEDQRNKNNDLRQKNWKAMEALSAAEKSQEMNMKETEKSIQARLEKEQEAFKNLLERIFPSIRLDEKIHEDWLVEFEKMAKNHLEEINSAREKSEKSPQFNSAYAEELESKNNQLEALVVHYKKIIEDTEGMLNKLQNHIEQEEIRWRQQYEKLESENQILKDKLALVESANEKLELKTKELEEKNKMDEESSRRECQNLRLEAETEKENKRKLSEKMEEINLKLAEEEEKNNELSNEIVKLRNAVKFGQETYVEENKRRLELEDELKLVKSENARDAPINNSGDFVAFEKSDYERM